MEQRLHVLLEQRRSAAGQAVPCTSSSECGAAGAEDTRAQEAEALGRGRGLEDLEALLMT